MKGLLDVGLDLPVLVADDDFFEHLQEHGYTSQIDMDELLIEWDDWAKENIDE
jgi:hypothetical protein